MVHTFTQENTNIAFDQESGALHVFDDAAFEVLRLYIAGYGKKPEDSSLDEISARFNEDVTSCCNDIDELIGQGMLFAPPQDISISDFYKDEPKIKALCLHICHDCNLRCKYCFAHTGDFNTGKRSMLSFETGRKAIDFIVGQSGSRRNIDVDFFGGEPLLNWDTVVALTGYCEEQGLKNDKNIRLTITTNAVLLDDDKTEFINKHMANCVLSLDGRPSVNDAMRPGPGGKGSYDKVSGNIQEYARKSRNRPYYVRGTYTHDNLDFSEDVKHIISLGITQISIEPVVGSDNSGYEIKKEDLPVLFKEYEKLARYYLDSRNTGKPFEFFHFNVDLTGGPCAYKRLKGCGVGTEYVAVTPDGDIYPCHQFTGQTEFLMGNVLEEPVLLKQEVKDMFSGLLVPQKPVCNECWAKYFCSGGCPANAYYATGSVNGVCEIGCALQKKRIECALWLKTQERDELKR